MNLGDKKPGKTPTKRPLYVYYIIVGVIIVLLNILVVPAIQERSIEKTDYSTFIKSVEKGNVTRATIEEGYIYYEVKSPKTGDDTNIWLPIFLLVLSVGGIAGIFWYTKKKNHKE